MNKKKNWLFMLLWLLVAATSRIQYFFFGGQSIVDTYAYFAYAMMRAEKRELVLNSGLSYAFTNSLTRLLRFTGNLIEVVGIYQLLIQILWIVLLLVGLGMLFGKLAGFISSGILIVSPWILKSIFSVSPENYFMLYFSVLLVALGYFHVRAVKGEWHRSVWDRLYLKAAGFFVGIVCIWNYLGWILPVMMVYVLIHHSIVLKDKIRQQRQQKDLKEKKRIMGAGSQLFHLLIGWIIGIYATLMKYTGLTGNTIEEQFNWWLAQFKEFPARCQDVSTVFSIWLMGAVAAGVLCQLMYHVVKTKKTKGVAGEQEPENLQNAEEKPETEALQVTEEKPETEALQNTEEEPETEALQTVEEAPEIETVQAVEEAPETGALQAVEELRETETVQAAEKEQKQGTEFYMRPEKNSGTERYRKPEKKVQFLENPLPVPKKHVRKDMEFDFDEVKMDFDIDICENDDFDI